MTAAAAWSTAAADRLVQLLEERPPTLGPGRLLCIDGPAGSGKSTLAAAVAAGTGAPVLAVDDLLDGWSGLPRVHHHVSAVLEALAQGEMARWRSWDWAHDRRGTEHTLLPCPLLVVEGVGAGQRPWASLTTVLAWVEAPPDERLRRALARDGDGLREHWLRWRRAEERLFAENSTRARADLVVTTTDPEEDDR